MTAGRVIVFIGAAGSGKGTQSLRLASELGIPCLSTGEALRAEAERPTPAGVRLRRLLASGSLVSDEVVCKVVASRLRAQTILDGFPRTVRQASFLDGILAEMGLPRPLVFHLDVPKAALIQRLAARRHCVRCGCVYNLISRPSLGGLRCEIDGGPLTAREDDKKAAILKRLAEYDQSASALIEYYAGADYYRLEGVQVPDAIAATLVRISAHQHTGAALLRDVSPEFLAGKEKKSQHGCHDEQEKRTRPRQNAGVEQLADLRIGMRAAGIG